MKALLLTNEYPPNVYGGAGVHVEYLSRELARQMDVEVRCFGDQLVDEDHLRVIGYRADPQLYTAPEFLQPVLGALVRSVYFSTTDVDADVVHCHTWYSHLGGILVKQIYGVPLVVTTHSLEPLRPWKREQLKGGYDVSLWLERTALEMADAIITVSAAMSADVLAHTDVQPDRVHVIHNGIDTERYRPVDQVDALPGLGVDPDRPYVLFVGRVTRQKGLIHLLRAIPSLPRDVQVVLVAGAPDTPEIAEEMEEAVSAVAATRTGVVWIGELSDRDALVQLYSHAAVFCCPSVYEPFGIINLEAMACGVPVVASNVGGIPEVVVDGETGILVPIELRDGSSFEPRNPAGFSDALAAALNRLLDDADLRSRMGEQGRRRAVEQFSWPMIARQTMDVYRAVIS